MDLNARIASIEAVLADPPLVHKGGAGTWSTARSAYKFMATHLPAGARTLETGLGVSTVLFALWSAEHTCVVWNQSEADEMVAYLNRRGYETDHVRFFVGSSVDVLPTIPLTQPVDLFFIDGGHFFPVPIIDFFYGSRHLKAGGLLVVDDSNLASVKLGLLDFLAKSPNWQMVNSTVKWLAYRRLKAENIGVDEQRYLARRGPNLVSAERLVPQRARPAVERLVRRIGIY